MNANSKLRKLMAAGNKIVACEFKKSRSGFVSLEGEFDNGQKCTVIELFDERVRLKEKDFIGLTIREAQAMHVHECTHLSTMSAAEEFLALTTEMHELLIKAKHSPPEIRRKVAEQITAVTGNATGDATAEQLRELLPLVKKILEENAS